MSYRNWPKQIEGNKFSLAKLDPEVPPVEMRVVAWSNVFGDGGTVAIEGYDKHKERMGMGFGSIKVERNGSVEQEREHLQDILDDFTSKLADNWRTLIENARTSVTEFYTSAAAEYTEKAEAAKNGDF